MSVDFWKNRHRKSKKYKFNFNLLIYGQIPTYICTRYCKVGTSACFVFNQLGVPRYLKAYRFFLLFSSYYLQRNAGQLGLQCGILIKKIAHYFKVKRRSFKFDTIRHLRPLSQLVLREIWRQFFIQLVCYKSLGGSKVNQHNFRTVSISTISDHRDIPK